jgi:selenocysteine lyase/cysteine desulfurase
MTIGIPAIGDRIQRHAGLLRTALAGMPAVTLHDAPGSAGIVTFSVGTRPASAVQAELAAAGILVGVSDHRYAALDLQARGLTAILRASPHYYNDEAEIDRLIEAIARLAA